jgi:MFS family permease
MYAIGLMAFILLLSTMVGLPVLPRLSKELGADVTEIPIVLSAALVTMIVAQFFTGSLADRYSSRTLILVGAMTGSVSSLLCVVAGDWVQLVVLRVVGGAADAVAMPALLTITATLGKGRTGKFFGILRSAQGLSFVVAPALGSALSLVSLRTPFIVDGLLSLVAMLGTILLMQNTDKTSPEHHLSVFRRLRSVFSKPRVYLYLLMGVSGLFGFGIFYTFIPTKAQVLGLAPWQVGVILSGGALVFSVMSFVVGVLSDRFGRRMFGVVSQLIIVGSGIGLMCSEGFVSLLLFYGLFCVGETTTYLLCFVYAGETFGEKHTGTAMGAFDSVVDLSLFVAPLIAISVHRSTGWMVPVFLIAVVPAMWGFFATVVWLPREAKG